jgi:hypothetical protein
LESTKLMPHSQIIKIQACAAQDAAPGLLEHDLAASMECCAFDVSDCTLEQCFDDDLNTETPHLPALAHGTVIDSMLLELCTMKSSVQSEIVDFEPIRRLRSFPAAPPKQFYAFRWRKMILGFRALQRRQSFAP